METVRFYFLGLQKHCGEQLKPWNKKTFALRRKVVVNLDTVLKSRVVILPTKVHIIKTVVFQVVMCRCKSWTTMKANCQRIDVFELVLEKTLESPLDSKKTKSVNPKGNQPWIFIGRTDAEAEAPILRPPEAKSQVIGKDPDAGKDREQKEKGGNRGWGS